MSIADNLITINECKKDIRTSILSHLVDVPENTAFTEYSSKIDEIPSEGGRAWPNGLKVGYSTFTGSFPFSNIDMRLVTDFTSLYRGSSIKSCTTLDTSNATSLVNLFNGCSNLETVGMLECGSVENWRYTSGMFTGCSKLVTIEGLNNYGAGWKRGDGGSGIALDLYDCSVLSTQSLRNIFNTIADINDKRGVYKDINLRRRPSDLTDEDIAIATNKGWGIAVNLSPIARP